MTLLICFGTRPEYLKILSLYQKLIDNNFIVKLLYVKQHKDLVEDISHDYTLNIEESTNRLDSIVLSILNNFDKIPNFDYVLVQGDTATSYSISLACYHRKIKIIHLEAGLRTYDNENPYPEDVYRRFISTIAYIHFCPTENNVKNLNQEKIYNNIYVVGNTIIDLIKSYNYEVKYNNQILITLHRRENWDMIPYYFKKLEELAEQYPQYEFIYPVHFNDNIKNHSSILKKIRVINPLIHKDLCKIISECRFIISDSGGIQEEASFYGKKVI